MHKSTLLKIVRGSYLTVQWLRPCASIAGGAGSIPGWRAKIPHASRCSQKRKRERE